MTSLPPVHQIREIIVEMKDDLITRDAIEKLQSLIPTDDEIVHIKQAQDHSPHTPLGSAEQFLLVLSHISGLDSKLKLWLFKLDFKVLIK